MVRLLLHVGRDFQFVSTREYAVHGRVQVPSEVTSATRGAVYRIFLHSTPFAVFDVVRSIRLRLLFIRDDSVTHIQITNLCVLPYAGGPPVYEDLLYVLIFLLSGYR